MSLALGVGDNDCSGSHFDIAVCRVERTNHANDAAMRREAIGLQQIKADRIGEGCPLALTLTHTHAVIDCTGQTRPVFTSIGIVPAAREHIVGVDVNVHVEEDGIRRFLQINIALAVAIDGGLLAPVLRDAGARSLSSIAEEAASLAARARARSLSADDLKGATFTVSNLGSFGVSAFDAIVSPPQAAVLAVGAARRQACEGQGGAVIFASVMTATLSCDHRAVDGALAGRFLSALKRRIEAPSALGA